MTYSIAPVLVTAPDEVVSLLEAKQHLRNPDAVDDALVASLVSAAVTHLDGWSGILGRCLLTQTWRQDMAEFPCRIRLPFPDVQSVTIAYSDAANATQTLAGANYHLVNRVDGAWLELADGASWPSTYTRPDAVRVSLVCGYTAVPDDLKAAILLHVGFLYENREAVNVGNLTTELPMAYGFLTQKYRRVAF